VPYFRGIVNRESALKLIAIIPASFGVFQPRNTLLAKRIGNLGNEIVDFSATTFLKDQ